MTIADDVRAGLERGELFVEYLPTVTLEGGCCVGGEALVRWRRGREVVTAAAFIPAIENTPLSGKLTYWVIDTVAAELGDWLAANGGDLPNAPGCPPPDGNEANDPVMLQIRVRTPTNARSFKLKVNFLSSEYPEWTCTEFNDFFVVLLDSTYTGTPENPADKNLAVYTSPSMAEYPVGVNLAYGNTGLFTSCINGPGGCSGSPQFPFEITTCTDSGFLPGTGFDTPAPFSCSSDQVSGGGTGWLTTSGNVVGGEIMTLRLAIWDTSDSAFDSTVLIDDFQWSVEAAEPGTVIE